MGTGTAAPDGGPFVGRDAELAELAARVSAAAAGAGGLLLLSGPAGIGKTRTVEEALPPGRAAVPVVWGRCVDDPGAPPLWPWRRVVRALPAVAAAVTGALAEVDRAGGGADPDAARFRLTTTVTDALLDCAADGSGLVVVLEDLHWADESSLRLLRHLAGELPRSRLLVVGTVRDPDGARTGRALDAALPGLLREPGVRSLRLRPLTEDDVRTYLRAATPQLVRAVHRRSGGVPLYLRAVARSPDPGAGADGQAELRALVRTTLTALPPAALDLLDAAAVLGEEVDAARLTAVTGRPIGEVATGLDAAVRGGMLAAVPDAPGRRRFAHAAVRDAVYADLAPSVREELHRRAAEALGRLAGQDDADDALAGLVAGHWLRAAAGPETLRRAAAWAQRAAATATRLLAFDEAARLLATALDAARRAGADRAERAVLLVDLATAEFRAGRFDAALEHAVAGADAAGGDPGLLAAAALTVHDVSAPGFVPALVRLCERALAAVDGARSPALRSRLLSQLASVQADAGRMAVAAGNAAAALDLARACGDSEAVLDAVRARTKASPTALAVTERLDLGRLAIEHAAGTGQPLAELWGAKWRIDAGLETGDMDVVRDELDRVSALAASTRLPLVRWHDRRLRASLAALLGRFDEALALNEEARAIGSGELAGDLSTVGLSDAFALQHALVTGRDLAWDDEVLATLDRAGDVPVVLVSRALVDLLRGRREEATARYAALRDRLSDPDFVASGGVPLNLVPLVEEFGDVAAAEVLHAQLSRQPYAAGGAGVYCQGSYASLVARLAVVRGRLDEAVRWFEEALAVDTGTGARPATVHDRVGLAGALLERAAPGDVVRAGELARAAAGEARRLGMPGPERQAGALAERVARAARAADPLTAREREIALLVARAWTNRRIAEELVVSERTVESHVRSVLAKLGAANRTELATLIGRS
ncbi:ATP-binding protein [Blastococcus sp. SYSU D00695]